MPLVPIAKKGKLTFKGLRGSSVELRPAMIVSVIAGPPTRIETIDGVTNLVLDTPEEIDAMMAKGGRKLLASPASYAKLKAAIREDDLESYISGEDGKAMWIEALREVSYGSPRSKLFRMLRIYSELLSPFSFIKAFSHGFRSNAPSPLDAEMLAKGYLRDRSR